jgi:ABC-type transport system involved in cytochrome c biogenesis permease subunit
VYYIKPLKALFSLASVSAVFGVFVQFSGLLARIIILDRPPVGSLYESLLFVGFIVVLCALIILCFRRQVATLLGGVSAALSILLVAPYIAPDGDNLETLVAVLNTNFWLATHVICITVGYGVCILSAMLSHIYLFRRGQGDRAEGLWSLLYIIAMVALFFTAFGTMLGGIWADQSWGRFWGWDPKENGALIIVLWIVWLVHARLGNHLSRVWLAAGFAMLNVIVALAWFGVNLLSVGLHSYGFISGIATGLTAFCVSEFVVIGLLLLKAQGKKREA